jgi:hypothetical protein
MTKPIRPIRIEGNIAYVPLTQGKEAVIDVSDLPIVEGFNWYALRDRNTFYAARYARKTDLGRGSFVMMHRVFLGEPDSMVDHEDGDGLNNRRKNLRLATAAQNAHNSVMKCRNTSGYKGVYWSKRDKKWRSQIMTNSVSKSLGLFDTPEAAAAAYAKASAELHGEFGRLA